MRRYSDLLVFIPMLAVSLWIMYWQNNRVDAAAASTLAGALFGGAALMLGNWINRYNDSGQKARDLENRRHKVKILVVAELVDVATGLIDANEFASSALVEVEAKGGFVGLDLTRYLRHSMPLTFSLGADLLLLDERSIDALAILRANLGITRSQFEEAADRTSGVGWVQLTTLVNGLKHTTGICAECFERIAPERKLKFQEELEPAATILRRAANGGTARNPRSG